MVLSPKESRRDGDVFGDGKAGEVIAKIIKEAFDMGVAHYQGKKQI